MKWRVLPSTCQGSITVPPSKSHTIRALLVATLAPGESVISRPLLRGDGRSAIQAAQALGATVIETKELLRVQGVGGDLSGGKDLVFTGNSGTTTNLFMSAAALGSRPRRFDGDSSLRSRPVRTLLSALQELGAEVTRDSAGCDVPFVISGPIRGGRTKINGVSSQYVSSLLFSCPLANGNTEFQVDNLQERPYVELSLWWLEKLGIRYEASDDRTRFFIPGGQHYEPLDLTIPSDFSSATFAAVAAAITGCTIRLSGLDFSDPQGDKDIFDVLTRMGAQVTHQDGIVQVTGKPLTGCEIDLNTMPDALPAVAVAACCAQGETRIVNVAHARIKETDRIAVMTHELSAMGARIQETPDGLIVQGTPLTGTNVNGHHDHRVVMALALAGLTARGETIISTAEAAEVTYPGFVKDFQALGAHIEILED